MTRSLSVYLKNIHISKVLAILFTVLLSACNNSNDNPEELSDNIIRLDDRQSINQSVDLFLHFPFDEVTNINWQQTTGPSVDILANTSKVISFTPTQSGIYGFTVEFTLNNTSEQSLTHSVTITDDALPITARLSHAVLADNKVSLRSQLNDRIDASTIVWVQQTGDTVTLENNGDNNTPNSELAIFFDAPQVDNDTIISFTVTATSFTGTTYSDSVGVLVETAPSISSNAYFDDRVADVFVYNPESPYAESLVPCVYANTLTSSCTLSQTPLLANEVDTSSSVPTIDNIMDRVVVSHQWMGDRFKEFLTNYDSNNDIKSLLRATTAIVIAYDIRPSFYWAATGAIYLDAENFWLTPTERDTINEAPDFRSSFGNELQFVTPWRYIKNNSYASNSFSRSSRVTRSPEDGLYRLQALLYHELAHANDFFPSNEWYIHNAYRRVLDAAISSNFESDELAISFPLTSQELYGLAEVSFSGEDATNTQISFLPSDIATFFSSDSASDYYAYSSLREDYAMLFEELMMQHRFGLQRDVAITNQPTGDNISATDYIVTWGQRGRIGDDKLKDRVLFTASRVLPEFDSQEAVNQLPSPIQMTADDNWIDNLTISPEALSLLNLSKSLDVSSQEVESNSDTAEDSRIPMDNRLGYYQKPLPNH